MTFVQADIADGERRRARRSPSIGRPRCLNLAAETHVDRSIDGPRAVHRHQHRRHLRAARGGAGVRRASCRTAARDAFRFLHVSTDEVYGTLGRERRCSARRRPTRRTRRTRRARRRRITWCAPSFHTYGLPVLITNCSNNYGPFQFPEKLIPLMLLNALDGTPLPIYGDGGNVRDWLHVEDHCAGILLVLREGPSGREVQHRRRQRAHQPRDRRSHLRRASRRCSPAASQSGAASGALSRPEDVRAPIVPATIAATRSTPTKIRRELGWAPRHAFERGPGATLRAGMSSTATGANRSGRALRDEFGKQAHLRSES